MGCEEVGPQPLVSVLRVNDFALCAEVGGSEVATKSISEITGREIATNEEHACVRNMVRSLEAKHREKSEQAA